MMAQDKTDAAPPATSATIATWNSAVAFAAELLSGNIMLKDIRSLRPTALEFERIGIALKNSLCNPDTNDFDVGVDNAASMLREGQRLPDWLAVFAADVLEGKRKRPTKRGPDLYANWIRDYNLARAVQEVANRFDSPAYSNNELFDKITAAQIVAKAAHLSIDVVHHAIKRFGGEIRLLNSPQDKRN